MAQLNLDKIKEVSQVFFSKTNLGIEVEVGSPQNSTIPINLKVEEPQTLIGERGQTLAEIQHLLRLVLRRQTLAEEPLYINLDINDYKKKKAEYLAEVAKNTADEVVLTKKEKQLPAMSAFERRVIHLALASRGDVVTESLGQEPARYVVIRFYP